MVIAKYNPFASAVAPVSLYLAVTGRQQFDRSIATQTAVNAAVDDAYLQFKRQFDYSSTTGSWTVRRSDQSVIMGRASQSDEPHRGASLPGASSTSHDCELAMRVQEPMGTDGIGRDGSTADVVEIEGAAAPGPSSPSKGPVTVDRPAIDMEPRRGGSGQERFAKARAALRKYKHALVTFGKFVGPGFMISVAYSEQHFPTLYHRQATQLTPSPVDPGNYATDIAAGASYRFRLLFVVLLSNLFAILLQSLAVKLGTVTGLDLASACRAYLPRWLNYVLYGLAEIAIIATDISEVSRDLSTLRIEEDL